MNYLVMSEEKGRIRRNIKTRRSPKTTPKECLNIYMKTRTTWPSSQEAPLTPTILRIL
jgi:hypothetical protein